MSKAAKARVLAIRTLLNHAGGTCAFLGDVATAIADMNREEWDNSPIQSEIAAAVRIVVAEHIDAEEATF